MDQIDLKDYLVLTHVHIYSVKSVYYKIIINTLKRTKNIMIQNSKNKKL